MAKSKLPKEVCGSWWAMKGPGYVYFCKQDEAPEKRSGADYRCAEYSPSTVMWTTRNGSFTINGKSHKISTLAFPPDSEFAEGLSEIIVHEDRTLEIYEYI